MSHTATIGWFARHELTLVWRDWMSMMTAGRTARERFVVGGVAVFVVLLHGLAYAVLDDVLAAGVTAEKATLVALGAMVVLAFSLMLSLAIELITRAFYTRADLDLILSSPASSPRLFCVRMVAIVISTSSLSLSLAAPFINVAAFLDGPRWLIAYPGLLALAALATAMGLVATVAMFRTIGLRHSRLVAQIFAAIVGAGFLIGTQVAAIIYFGSYRRSTLLSSEAFMAAMPDEASPLWLPARAFLGDPASAFFLVLLSLAVLGVTIAIFANGFSQWVVRAAGIAETRKREAVGRRAFRARPARATLRAKEWQLLGRDPWLVSQSLMQLL